MSQALIPPPEFAPPLLRCTPTESIALWVDLMNACEELLVAGIKRQVGPEGDWKAAYRQWYEGWAEEHDRTNARVAAALGRPKGEHGR